MTPTGQSDPLFVRFTARPEAPIRLYCFPFAGGSASYYSAWADQAPPEIELTAIQPPGRESRAHETVITKLPRLVGVIARALAADPDPRNAIFFGHCTGGILALETCRAMERIGRAPLLLGMSATPPLHHAWWADGVYASLARDPLRSFVDYGGTLPEAVRADPALITTFTQLLNCDAALYRDYGSGLLDPVGVPLCVFSSHDDLLVTPDELDRWADWSRETTTRHRYPGDHFYLQNHGADITRDLLADTDLRRLSPNPL